MRFSIPLILLIFIISGCSRNSIKPYPSTMLPPSAPPSSKERCESLPPLPFTTKKAISDKEYLAEIQKTRIAYQKCAERHNVLIRFEDDLEKGVISIYNHYQK